MVRKYSLLGLTLAAGLFIGVAGCGSSTTKPGTKPAADSSTGQSDAAKPESGENAEIAASLAKLSAQDRALAEKQKVCPVTGEPLGAMGTPYKVVVQGQTVFLCCDGCEDQIKKDPDKYLAKLKAGQAK